MYEFWQKRYWNCAFTVPQIHILLWKGGMPPCNHQRSSKFRLKRTWNYAYLARKMQNFLRQGGSARQRVSPLDPVNASCKRSVCSLWSQLLEPPPMLKILLSLWVYSFLGHSFTSSSRGIKGKPPLLIQIADYSACYGEDMWCCAVAFHQGVVCTPSHETICARPRASRSASRFALVARASRSQLAPSALVAVVSKKKVRRLWQRLVVQINNEVVNGGMSAGGVV